MNHAFASDKTLKEGCEACLWPHTDGQGLHLILDVVPLDSRVTMRVPSENDEVPIGQHNLFSYRFSDRNGEIMRSFGLFLQFLVVYL